MQITIIFSFTGLGGDICPDYCAELLEKDSVAMSAAVDKNITITLTWN